MTSLERGLSNFFIGVQNSNNLADVICEWPLPIWKELNKSLASAL